MCIIILIQLTFGDHGLELENGGKIRECKCALLTTENVVSLSSMSVFLGFHSEDRFPVEFWASKKLIAVKILQEIAHMSSYSKVGESLMMSIVIVSIVLNLVLSPCCTGWVVGKGNRCSVARS